VEDLWVTEFPLELVSVVHVPSHRRVRKGGQGRVTDMARVKGGSLLLSLFTLVRTHTSLFRGVPPIIQIVPL
jgi:hypothetical protein